MKNPADLSKELIERGMKIPDMKSHINRLKASWRIPSPSDEVIEQWLRHRVVRLLAVDLLQKKTLKELLDLYDISVSIIPSKEENPFETACRMMIRSRELYASAVYLNRDLKKYCTEHGISRTSVGDEVNKRKVRTKFDQQLKGYCDGVIALDSKKSPDKKE
jgi:histidinol-phosphate/aromatic aminotransferase/cobyric acid decarboxylase-like protein